jgi:RloB-like protein
MSPLRRRGPVREPRPVWLILCEGTVTERLYLRDLQSRTAVQLVVEPCSGNPLTKIQQAKKRWKENPGVWERVWCVTDVDDHTEEVKRAEASIRDLKWLNLAISNPCIELWALLHFEDQFAWISSKSAQDRFEKHCPGYLRKKHLPAKQLFEREHKALERARKLTPGANPSTGIPDLIEALLAEGRRRG